MRRRCFLILHGIENHRPPGHWQFWLAARLAEDGNQVLYPQLPDADAPVYSTWERELHEQLALLDGDERVVICHSLSCLLWLQAAPGIAPSERATRLLLVAPPASASVPEAGASFRLADLDVAAVKASVTQQIRVVCSDNDPYNPRDTLARYSGPLGAEADVVSGGGHLTPADGYGPWPWVLDWCADPDAPFVREVSHCSTTAG